MSAFALPASASADPACQSVSACVVVKLVGPDGAVLRSVSIDADTLTDEADVHDAEYLVRSSRGASATDYGSGSVTGLSIRGLIAMVPNLDPSEVTFATITNDQPSSPYLRNQTGDFSARPGFVGDPPLEPVFFETGYKNNTQTGYLRPLRAQDETTDVNGADTKFSDDASSLMVTLHTSGDILAPTIHATPAQVKVNDGAVTLSASFTGSVPPGLTYTWEFGDGFSPMTSEPTSPPHVYTKASGGPGFYAYVRVEGADGSSGISNPSAKVVVTGPDPIVAPPGTPPSGDNHGGGGKNNPIPGPAAGGGTLSGGVPNPSSRPPGDGATDATTGAPASRAGAATGSGRASAAPASATGSLSAVAVPADGQVVGYLLAGPQGELPAAASVAARRPDSAAAARNERPVTHFPVWVLGVIGILALLVLGAGAEFRRPSRSPKRRAR